MNALRAVALLSALVLGGCAATLPPAEVTRFHLNQPIAPAQVRIEPRNRADEGSLEFQSHAAAVGAELTRLGFRLTPGLGTSELIAITDVRRGSRAALAQNSPFSVGIGGGSYGGGFGMGGGVSFPIGKRRSREVVVTELSVQLKRRSEGTVIWEGRAVTEARSDTPYASPGAAVQRLAAALFEGFPGESGRTITVP